MNTLARLVALAILATGVAGCVEDTGSGSGLSGTQSQFDAMTAPCISQAGRMTGVPQGAVIVTDRLQTGGGPLLTLSAAGRNLSCRLESDGRVTVFGEFAN